MSLRAPWNGRGVKLVSFRLCFGFHFFGFLLFGGCPAFVLYEGGPGVGEHTCAEYITGSKMKGLYVNSSIFQQSGPGKVFVCSGWIMYDSCPQSHNRMQRML